MSSTKRKKLKAEEINERYTRRTNTRTTEKQEEKTNTTSAEFEAIVEKAVAACTMSSKK